MQMSKSLIFGGSALRDVRDFNPQAIGETINHNNAVLERMYRAIYNDTDLAKTTARQIADDAITTDAIADGSVTTPKVGALAIVAAKIAENAVEEAHIIDDAITTAKVAADAIIAAKINVAALHGTTGAVNASHIVATMIATNAVTEAKIIASAITAGKTSLAAINSSTGAVNSSHIVAAMIATNAVEEAKIIANAITEGKIAANAVSLLKLAEVLKVRLTYSLRENCVGHYKLNDNLADTVVIDSSGANNTGTLAGGDNTEDLNTTGKVKDAFHFNGTDDNVDCGNNNSLNLTGPPLSINAWIKRDVISNGYQGIFGTSTAGGYTFYLDNTNILLLSRSGTNTKASTDTVGDTNWHMVTVTYAANGDFNFYIDGVPDSGNPQSESWSAFTQNHNYFIGSFEGAGFFDGIIDNVMILNKVLTDIEIAALLNNDEGTENLSEVVTGAIYTDELATNSIVSVKIAADAVTASKINVVGLDGTSGRIVVADQTDADVVTGGINTYAATLIQAGKIVISGATNLDNWSHGSDATKIDGGDIYTQSVTATQILANTITAAEIAANAVAASELNVVGIDGTTGRIVVADATDANAVTAGINTHAATLIQPGKILISGATNLDNWSHGSDATKIDGGDIYANSVTTSQVAADAITAAELNIAGIDGTTGRILVADATDANAVTAGINSFAATYIAPGKILISGAVNLDGWQDSGDATLIDGGQLAADSVTAAKINVVGLNGATGRIVVADATDANVVTGGINTHAATLIQAGKILISGATDLTAWSHGTDATKIDGGEIYTDSIVAGSILADTITANEIAVGTLTVTELANDAVETAIIKNVNVTTGKLENNAATVPVAAYTAAAEGFDATPDTMQSVEFTTTGEFLSILFSLQVVTVSGAGSYVITVLRDGDTIFTSNSVLIIAGSPFAAVITDSPGADTYTYYVKAASNTGTAQATNRSLIVTELKK